MESSIAEFDERQLACELLPTESRQDQARKLVKCFGHLKRCWDEPAKEISGLRIPAS